MNDEAIARFHATGYACPLTMMSPDEMRGQREAILDITSRPSPLFASADVDRHRCIRNRHLDSKLVLDLACHPSVIESVAAVLGPDLILWRTDFFIQGKTDPETSWHQDRQFSGPRRLPSLVIPDAEGKPSVTDYAEDKIRGAVPVPRSVSAWLAITDTDRSTGCVMVIEASNREGVIPDRAPRPGEKPIFGKGRVLDYDIPTDRIRYMELAAGQYFLFERLTLHASVATESTAPRIGISLRYTTPDVLVYPGYTVDGQGFAVEPYRVLLVRGEDRFRYNGSLLETAQQRRAQLG